MNQNLRFKTFNIVWSLGFLFLMLGVSSAGEREQAIMLSCASLTGGEPTSLATCVSGALTEQEIENFFQGKAFGCGNEIRKLFSKWDSGCQKKKEKYPRLKFLMPYKSGYIIGYDGNSLYYSPDGKNLRGGGNTKLVYNAGQAVLKIMPYRGGVMTAFEQGGIYFSPDGNNIGGGGRTERRYAGQRVTSMKGKRGGIETCFTGGGCYFSPDGYNLGGGGTTIRSN